MKKAIAILCTVVMLISLCACGNSTTVTRGTITDNVYESSFIGIGCTLPDGFVFSSDEQIAQSNSATYDNLGDIGEDLATADVIYDMAAMDQQGSSVSVNIENLGVLGLQVGSAEEYAALAVDQTVAPLEELGFSNIDAFQNSVTFAGAKHPAVQIVASHHGMTCYQTCVCIMVDNYVASVSIGSFDKATHDALLASFYALTPVT